MKVETFAILVAVFIVAFALGWILRSVSNILKAQPGAVIEMESVPVQVMPASPFKFVLPDGSEVLYDRRR